MIIAMLGNLIEYQLNKELDMNELHCKLFVDTWLSIEELTHELSNRLNLKYDKFLSIEGDFFIWMF